MSNELVKHPQSAQALSVFSNSPNFEHAQRIAKMLCTSTLVPQEYQNNLSNTLVALEMANRVGASPLMVMQNLNIIQGRPSWSSPFIIASINSCGRFAPMRFEFQERGEKNLQYEYWTGSKAAGDRRKQTGQVKVNDQACRAWTTDASGERLEGPWVSIELAVAEGWYTKSDSKWKTMPEVMLRYRAAAFFGRLYCPEIMLGMQTSEELTDIGSVEVRPASNAEAINEKIKRGQVQDAQIVDEILPPNPVNQMPTFQPVDAKNVGSNASGAKKPTRSKAAEQSQTPPPPTAAEGNAQDEDLV